MKFGRRVTEFSTADTLPRNITQLTLSEYFHELKPKVLPPDLMYLEIDNYQPAYRSVGGYLQPGVLPATLMRLRIGAQGFTVAALLFGVGLSLKDQIIAPPKT